MEIKLKEILSDLSLYNNTKLYEGLIITHSIENSISILQNNDYKIFKVDKDKNTIELKIIKLDNIDKLFPLINNLGWFVSQFQIKYLGNKDIQKRKFNEELFNKVLLSDYEYLILILEAKYDIEINKDKLNFIYHITSEINLKKIKEKGLYPKSKSKRDKHLNRIYFITDLKNTEKLIKNLGSYSAEPLIILKMRVSDLLSNIRFFKDPNFIDGIYTLDNIQPEYIEILN